MMPNSPAAAVDPIEAPRFDNEVDRTSWAWGVIAQEFPRARATPFPAEKGWWIVTGTGFTISWGRTPEEAAFASARLLLHTQQRIREYDEMQSRKRR
jgi:hypothetical protein